MATTEQKPHWLIRLAVWLTKTELHHAKISELYKYPFDLEKIYFFFDEANHE